MWPADFVEENQDFELGFQFVGNGFNDQVGFPRRTLNSPYILQAQKGNFDIALSDIAALNGPLQIPGNLSLRPAKAGGKDIFNNSPVAGQSGSLRDGPARGARSDDGYSAYRQRLRHAKVLSPC